MTRIPIPPPQEPLTIGDEGRANDNWYRYWDDTGRGVNENTTAVAAVTTATTFAQTILATTTSSAVQTILGYATQDTVGSWTPELAIGGTTIASAPSLAVGRYVRTPSGHVTAWGTITVTTLGATTGAVSIAGLPVAASNTVAGLVFPGAPPRLSGVNLNSAFLSFGSHVSTGGTHVNLTFFSSNASGSAAFPSTQLTTAASISVSVAYETSL